MRIDLCYCALIIPIATKTKVVVVMHNFEQFKSTNTVRLLKFLIPNVDVQMWGGLEDNPDLSFLEEPSASNLLLFPGPDAPILDSEFLGSLNGPATLVVPDGTWHQAKRIAGHRNLGLRKLQKVRLAPGALSEYRLRTSQSDEGLCTLEAVARALGVLEGPEVHDHLQMFLEMMVERVMWSRYSGASLPATSPAHLRCLNHLETRAAARV